MNNPIKIGLLGAGYILEAHVRALRVIPNVAPHVVCDQSASRAQTAAKQFGIPHTATSLDALLASDCDAVHVLLPPLFHASAAQKLLEAGKHVFIEKPMALSGEECARLSQLARERQLRLGVNHNFLFLPAYEEVRSAYTDGRIGEIDHLTVNWLYALPLLQFGPFDNWMVAEPRNLVFELAPHLAAFVIDLVGLPKDVVVAAGNPIDLPGRKRVYRHINALGQAARASVVVNLSVSPGQADRSLRVRGTGGVAHFDFERDVAWIERVSHANPIVDNYRTSRRISTAIAVRAHKDFSRYIYATLRKTPGANPFQESIVRSIKAFYQNWGGELDRRLSGDFGTQVITFCEVMATKIPGNLAGAEPTSQAASLPPAKILVVGGTGFIGRRLVEHLVAKGHRVRVLTRNIAAARALLGGMQVELMQGSHGSEEDLRVGLQGVDAVYHLAKAQADNWDAYIANDIEPTRRLAEAAITAGVKRFIYTGTIDSYASARASDTITADTPLDPAIGRRNLYARSKAACETLLKEMYHSRGLPLVIFRPGIVIGKGSPPAHWGVGRFSSSTDVQFWGDGRHPLPFVLVDDVAKALTLALDVQGIEGETFLLTDRPLLSAQEYVEEVAARSRTRVDARPRSTWRFFAEDVLKELIKNAIRHPKRRRPSYHDWDCRSHRARYDSEKTRAMLGWAPAGDRQKVVEEGIYAAVDEFMR